MNSHKIITLCKYSDEQLNVNKSHTLIYDCHLKVKFKEKYYFKITRESLKIASFLYIDIKQSK
jgi:hypothetical protein